MIQRFLLYICTVGMCFEYTLLTSASFETSSPCQENDQSFESPILDDQPTIEDLYSSSVDGFQKIENQIDNNPFSNAFHEEYPQFFSDETAQLSLLQTLSFDRQPKLEPLDFSIHSTNFVEFDEGSFKGSDIPFESSPFLEPPPSPVYDTPSCDFVRLDSPNFSLFEEYATYSGVYPSSFEKGESLKQEDESDHDLSSLNEVSSEDESDYEIIHKAASTSKIKQKSKNLKRSSSFSNTSSPKRLKPLAQLQKPCCGCKKSKCISFHCPCLKAQKACTLCDLKSCENTKNSPKTQTLRNKMRKKISCQCTKQACDKNYCACMKAGLACGKLCHTSHPPLNKCCQNHK